MTQAGHKSIRWEAKVNVHTSCLRWSRFFPWPPQASTCPSRFLSWNFRQLTTTNCLSFVPVHSILAGSHRICWANECVRPSPCSCSILSCQLLASRGPRFSEPKLKLPALLEFPACSNADSGAQLSLCLSTQILVPFLCRSLSTTSPAPKFPHPLNLILLPQLHLYFS